MAFMISISLVIKVIKILQKFFVILSNLNAYFFYSQFCVNFLFERFFLFLFIYLLGFFTILLLFLGATDSAVPCAMMLNLIAVMKEDLEKIRKRTDLSLKLIFFDGEEAFRNWGPTDSIYGARHLAEKYSKQHLIVKSTNEEITDLHRIDLFILLDLLGAPDPRFYSYFRDTEKWFVTKCNVDFFFTKFCV